VGALRAIAWAVVLASLAANAALWLRRPAGAAASAGTGHAPGAMLELAPPAATRPRSPAVATGDLAGCQARLAAAETAVQRGTAELRKRLSLHQLYQLGQPTPEAAAAFAPMVDRALAASGAPVPNHALECRDVVCKLGVVMATDGDRDSWMQALQRRDTELRRHTAAMAFHVGNPTQDPVTKEGLVQYAVYFRLSPPAAPNDAGAR
jgi:hypothetical protein